MTLNQIFNLIRLTASLARCTLRRVPRKISYFIIICIRFWNDNHRIHFLEGRSRTNEIRPLDPILRDGVATYPTGAQKDHRPWAWLYGFCRRVYFYPYLFSCVRVSELGADMYACSLSHTNNCLDSMTWIYEWFTISTPSNWYPY